MGKGEVAAAMALMHCSCVFSILFFVYLSRKRKVVNKEQTKLGILDISFFFQ